MFLRKRRSLSLVAKLGLVVASVALSVLLAEFALRLVTREKTELSGMWTADDELGATLTPGFEGSSASSEFDYRVRINELGMRDDPIPDDLDEKRRVLVLGDSFVFGVGVDLEDSVAKALERNLEAGRMDTDFVGFNGGQPGSSTYHHLQLLKRLGPTLKPDYVVLVFFVGDDWFGNFPRAKPEESRRTFSGWLRVNSVLYRYLERLVFSRFREYDPYGMHRLEIEEGFRGRIDRVLFLLDEMKSTAEAIGAELLIAINPRFSQVYDDAWSKASLLYGLSESEYSINEPNHRFSQQLDQRHFWYLDLLGPFRREAKEKELHFALDGHWNEAGNEFVARLLAAEILSRSANRQAEVPSTRD